MSSPKALSIPKNYSEQVIELEITVENSSTLENIKSLLELYIVNVI
jgi:hypothetical protein